MTKLKTFVGLGPVMYVGHMYSPLVHLIDKTRFVDIMLALGMNNALLLPEEISIGLRDFVLRFPSTVWQFIEMITGMTAEVQADLSRMPVMARHEPGGTSMKNVMHWIQMIRSKRFQRFDYGKQKNLEYYGSEDPPEYDLELIKKNMQDVPMQLYAGTKDFLIHKKDLKKLLKVLP